MTFDGGEQEDRNFRRFRENTAADDCPICCEERPNIITVCCGQGVCITCMARWLSENESCHNCRAKIVFRPPTTSGLKKPVHDSPLRLLSHQRNWSDGNNDDRIIIPGPTSSPIRRQVHISSLRGNLRRTNSQFSDMDMISVPVDSLASSTNRRINGNNRYRTNWPTNYSGTSNFPRHGTNSPVRISIPDSINIVTPAHSINTHNRRIPESSGNNDDAINILYSSHPGGATSSSTSIRRNSGSSGTNNVDAINSLSSSLPGGATSTSRSRCCFPFQKRLRLVFLLFGDRGDIFSFVSPQESATPISMAYSDASYDDEDFDSSNDLSLYSTFSP